MWTWLTRFFARSPSFRPGSPPTPQLAVTEACVAALSDCMAPEIERGHEGVAYLLGMTNGINTLAVAAIRPQARTTHASFHVDSPAAAQVVRTAVRCGLQLVGQVHSHPGEAYHSDGDVAGARIAYTGFVSLVLPDYGRRLPHLDGMAAYMFQSSGGFVPLGGNQVTTIPGQLG